MCTLKSKIIHVTCIIVDPSVAANSKHVKMFQGKTDENVEIFFTRTKSSAETNRPLESLIMHNTRLSSTIKEPSWISTKDQCWIFTIRNHLGSLLRNHLGSSLRSHVGSPLRNNLGSPLRIHLGSSLRSHLGS